MQHYNEHNSDNFIDPWYFLDKKRKDLLEKGWAEVFRKYLLEELPVEKIAVNFHKTMGRPTKEFYTMLGALVLQQTLDMTDEEVVDAIAFNIQWHYALDITSESDNEKYVSDRTLREYRSLVIEKNLDELLFDTLTDKLLEAFNVDTSKQRLDSTHIKSNMKNLGRIRIFARTIKIFLKNLKRQDKEIFATSMEETLVKRYLDKTEFGCFSKVKPSEGSRRLKGLSEDLYLLVERFKNNEKVIRMNSYKQMQRVLREQCEIVETEEASRVEVKAPKDIPSDSLQNPSDPDATYDGHKGQGYQVQIMETYQDAEGENRDETIPDLITYVEVEPAHESDANALLPAIEETKKRDCKPEILLADTLYGSDENVETAKAEGVEVITPTPKGGAKGDKIGLNEFDYDREKDSEGRCPEGQVSDDTKQTDNGTTVYFDKEKCLECSQRERCPVEINKSSARVKFDAKKVRLAKRRANEETGEFGDTYRWRAGVEATMSRYKSQTGAGQLRVRGKPAVRFAEKLKALGLNILRSAQSMSARKRLETAVI